MFAACDLFAELSALNSASLQAGIVKDDRFARGQVNEALDIRPEKRGLRRAVPGRGLIGAHP